MNTFKKFKAKTKISVQFELFEPYGTLRMFVLYYIKSEVLAVTKHTKNTIHFCAQQKQYLSVSREKVHWCSALGFAQLQIIAYKS